MCGIVLISLICKIIDAKSLEGKNLDQLRLMRNEIFAKHGYPFKNYELYLYFYNKDWYKPDSLYSEKRLSNEERKNIEIIKAKEKKLLKRNYIIKGGQKLINFDNIINKFQFGEFSDEELKRLCKYGFVVTPAKHQQFFHLYEKNRYEGIANFITTDAILQLLHMFFNFTLRDIEEGLFTVLKDLTKHMLTLSQDLYKGAKNEKIKEASKRSIAYFAVPYYFLTEDTSLIPKEVYDIVKVEINRCKSHKERDSPYILNPNNEPYDFFVDYTMFKPRGHYTKPEWEKVKKEFPPHSQKYAKWLFNKKATKKEKLYRYFMAMMWYGIYSLHSTIELELMQTLLITHLLYKHKMIDLWQKIYEITAFYVGYADDLTPEDFSLIINKVFGDDYSIENFANSDKLEEVKELVQEIFVKKTKIIARGPIHKSVPEFKFMGQRYIPDSEIMQRLVNWPDRPFPKGLDVMAVLGSEVAYDLLLKKYKEQEKWTPYEDTLNFLIEKFSKLKQEDWQKNLYYRWLYCIKSLWDLSQEFKYPFFMNNKAWQTKSLNSGLASWAELRHDAILYARPSGAEGANGEKIYMPEPPKGYVEPNIIFYERLIDMLNFCKNELKERNLLNKDWERKFDKFIEIASFLKDISIKELNKIPISLEEYYKIAYFGSTLEFITSRIVEVLDWWEVIGPDKNIPVIADIHRGGESVLEVGVGPVYEIYVVVEIDGMLKLTKGGVFTYYEFKWPAHNRLTDVEWQKMLDEGKAPSLADWIDIYFVNKPHRLPKFRAPIFSAKPGWNSGWSSLRYEEKKEYLKKLYPED